MSPADLSRVIVPPGTKVVLARDALSASVSEPQPAGAVGIVIRSPSDHLHAYRVRLVHGVELSVRRGEFHVLAEIQRGPLNQPLAEEAESLLESAVIYRCVVGSRAYGLESDTSDYDRRGIYLPSAEAHWSLYGVPEQLESDERQECFWELQKFLVLALKANPNILECLYTPLVELETPLAAELRAMRSIFLSKLIYQTYNGYVVSQFNKLQQDLRTRGEIRWQHAMHLIRLLLAGVTALREGFIPVRVETQREQLLAIRDGRWAWEQVDRWRLELHREFDSAARITQLADRPDYAAANALLVRARRSRVT